MDYNTSKDKCKYNIFIQREENEPIYVYRQSAEQRNKDVYEILKMDEWGELRWDQCPGTPKGERTDKMVSLIVAQEIPQPVFFIAQRKGGLICDDFLGSITCYEENNFNRIGYRPIGVLLYNGMPLKTPTHVDMNIELVNRIMKTPIGQYFEEGDLTVEIIAKEKAKRIFEEQS